MLYHFFRFLLKGLFSILFRLKVKGCENIPQNGPAIIACNHASFLDPPLIGVASEREVYFIARESLFKIWGFGGLIRKVNALPIKRSGFGPAGFDTLFKLLEEGKVILLFPEGTRSWNGLLQRPHSGIGMVAYKIKVPVIPALITGSHRALPRGSIIIRCTPISVQFGKPVPLEDYFIQPKSKQIYKLISNRIMEEIKKLGDSGETKTE